ncbi:MAG: glycosyltransferase 87 family protein, partial [Chloroflexota bacterium]|nr:glycosyltransferase 87 family protein [Chloroflexota bacterium]
MTIARRPSEPAIAVRKGRLHSIYSLVLSRPMLLPVVGAFLLYVALFLLLQGKPFALTPTHTLDSMPWLGRISASLRPDIISATGDRSAQVTANAMLYGLIALGLVGLWAMALWLVRPGAYMLGLRWVLLATVLFGIPLTLLAGMFSMDVYLYMFYGRIISTYGENPMLVAPIRFVGDPHLEWFRWWKGLPSAYGPVWLLLSGMLSATGGDSQFANVLVYKLALLGLHIITTVVVWFTLRRARPELATWGAIFYGWNPLVLLETVGNGHNDVMVAMFVALSLLSVAHQHWRLAVLALTAAAMVKVTALVLLPMLVLTWLFSLTGARARVRATITAGVVVLVGGLAMYGPLWAGTAVFQNAIDNPAATMYRNSLWELLRSVILSATGATAPATVSAYLHVVRNLVFVIAFLVLLRRLWRGRDMAGGCVWVWFAYCLSLSWIWPWYFVLAIPLAAVGGPGRTAALVAGLTLGGM